LSGEPYSTFLPGGGEEKKKGKRKREKNIPKEGNSLCGGTSLLFPASTRKREGNPIVHNVSSKEKLKAKVKGVLLLDYYLIGEQEKKGGGSIIPLSITFMWGKRTQRGEGLWEEKRGNTYLVSELVGEKKNPLRVKTRGKGILDTFPVASQINKRGGEGEKK